MTQYAVQPSTIAGLNVAEVAVAAEDTFPNDGKTVLKVTNGGAVPTTVTIASVRPCDYGFDHDLVIAIPAGEERVIGPFSTQRFTTTATVTYSEIALVTAAAVRI